MTPKLLVCLFAMPIVMMLILAGLVVFSIRAMP